MKVSKFISNLNVSHYILIFLLSYFIISTVKPAYALVADTDTPLAHVVISSILAFAITAGVFSCIAGVIKAFFPTREIEVKPHIIPNCPGPFVAIFNYNFTGDIAFGIWLRYEGKYMFGDGDCYTPEMLNSLWAGEVEYYGWPEMEIIIRKYGRNAI